MGVVVICWRARKDRISVGGGAAELQSPQILGVDRFVALQYFDGLVHCKPLPLATCRGRQTTPKINNPESTNPQIDTHSGTFCESTHKIPKNYNVGLSSNV